MRLLWLDISASYSHSSLALPALHSQLSNNSESELNGYLFNVLRYTIKKDPFQVLNEIITIDPDVVFATLWLFNSDFTIRILRELKLLRANVKIILGGPEFLGDNHIFLTNNQFVDAVFRGDGEEQFSALLSALKSSSGIKNIKGLCYINSEGDLIDNGTAYVSSFSSLNYPEASIFFNWNKPFIQIETSRGCFNRCSFCVSSACRRVENIPAEEIERRLENACRKGVKNIRILDRTFNADSFRALKLLDVFSSFSTKICFHVELHPAMLSPSLREKISSLPKDLLHIEAGIQSLDDTVLKACRRKGNSNDSLDGLRFLTSLNKFTIHADLIAGLPLYTYYKLLEDLNTLISTGVDEIQLELLKVLPGTDIINDCNKYGIKHSPVPDYKVLETSSVNSKELYRLSILSKIIDQWYNKGYFRTFLFKVAPANKNFIDDFLSYILEKTSLETTISPEKRGSILYDFCLQNHPDLIPLIKECWYEKGLSPQKYPGVNNK